MQSMVGGFVSPALATGYLVCVLKNDSLGFERNLSSIEKNKNPRC